MKDPDKASKFKGLAWLLAGVFLGVLFARGISPLVAVVPWSWENKLGDMFGPDPGVDICRGNSRKDQLLDKLLDRLYPLEKSDKKFPFSVRIVHDIKINAYAGLGGKIYINSGLLEQSESAEEIAGVLAHEMEHVRRRHILESVMINMMTVEGAKLVLGQTSKSEWADYFLRMNFSRAQEREADEGALVRLQKAHIDNRGFRDFFERMKDKSQVPAFLSDHPADQDRYEMVKKYPNPKTEPLMSREEWKTFRNFCR